MLHDDLNILQIEHPLILQLWFFGLGACVGSFLNVCVLRIPLGKSIVTPGSHCACGKPIAWYDNIPIFTWFILRGRARCCGRYFSVRYPLVELVTALVFWWLWYAYGITSIAYALAGMIFFGLLFMGSLIDIDHMVLPDSSTIGGMLAGVFLSFVFPQIQHVDQMGLWMVDGMRGMVMSMIGVLVGTGIVFWIRELGSVIFRKEAMGYGDIWLIGSIGAFCGWQGAIFAIFGGAVIGCLVILPWMIIASIFKKPAATNGAASTAPATTAPGALAATEAGEPVHEDAPPAKSADQPKPVSADESVLATPPAPGFGVEIPFGPWLALGGFIYYAVPFLHHLTNERFDFIHKLIFDISVPG